MPECKSKKQTETEIRKLSMDMKLWSISLTKNSIQLNSREITINEFQQADQKTLTLVRLLNTVFVLHLPNKLSNNSLTSFQPKINLKKSKYIRLVSHHKLENNYH